MHITNTRMLDVVFRGVKITYGFDDKQIKTIQDHFRYWVEHHTTYDESTATRAWVRYVVLHLPTQYFQATIEDRKVMWLRHIENIKREQLKDYR